ncbi:MAG: hypothetical protein CL943_01135 [Candidatus Diapherotrites archaeon]|uniref:Site-2 protease family protein n=1 Tax=Candidatus Iainarchaeum sp. TaxID=3101447 RepID=A0A2D6M0F2_9ARCH|nr:hypothetical protein [Candidatus Diapherotrites archaeon]|tara:strand:+ start:2319 stop:2885 length:567 start_codon:yes stop_codon:yes gene_type:complete
MRTTERNDLIVSWLTISVAFAILASPGFFNITSFVLAFPISAIVVGTGFISHELAHRQVARKFGAHAEYRAWQAGLLFALISSFMGFIFAAPGAVYIFGNISRKENGIISVAGPLTNIAVGIAFFGLTFLQINDWTQLLGRMGFQINIFLALFNMIPFPPLDGSKVFSWNPVIWGLVFFPIAMAFFFL